MSRLPFIPKPGDIDTDSLTTSLAEWAKTHTHDLYNVSNDEELESQLRSIFSDSTEAAIVEADGTLLSLEGFREKLRKGRGEGVEVISVSTIADDPSQPKLVRSQAIAQSALVTQMKAGWKGGSQRGVWHTERGAGDRLDVRCRHVVPLPSSAQVA